MLDLLSVARKDLIRYARDPMALVMYLVIPLLTGGLMVVATGGGDGPAPKVQLLVADQDDSFLTRLLLGGLGQGRAGDVLEVEKVDEAAGRRRLDAGEVSALVVIPKGFAEAVLMEQPVRLVLVTNPAQRIGPGIVEEMLSLLVDGVFYVHRLLGPELRLVFDQSVVKGEAPSDADVARVSASINRTVRKSERYLAPPVIQLETEIVKPAEGRQGSKMPFAFYFLPGVISMGLLFAAQGLSGDVWLERELGVLRRAVTTPLGLVRLMAGKLLAISAVLAGISLIVLAAGIAYLEIAWTRLPTALAWSVATGLTLTAAMLVLQVHARTRRGASFLTFAVVMPLMMLGGSLFPLEVMPKWMAAIGRWTPNGWAVEQLKAILLGRAGLGELSAAFGLAAAVSVVLLGWAGWRMHRVFARS